MTGSESIIFGGVSAAVGAFGAFWKTARYYQGKTESLMATAVTTDQCKRCQDVSGKDTERRDDAIEEVLRQIEALASKYDRILKILILNVDIPNGLKEQILP